MTVSHEVHPPTEPTGSGSIPRCSESSKTYFKLSLSSEQYFHQDVARGKQAESLGTVYNFPRYFGLKSNDWKGFDDILRSKNAQNPDNVEHVLIFLARHGQGYHNIGEEYLGSQTWKRTSNLSPKKAMHEHFSDTRLSPIGQHQADTLSRTLKDLLQDPSSSIPWPQAFYVSPLHRALETSYRTWAPLSNPERPYNPIIHDSLREQVYMEHCNRRSTRAEMTDFKFSHTTTPSLFQLNNTTTETPGNIATIKSSPVKNFDDIFSIEPSSFGPFTESDEFYSHQTDVIGTDETEMQTTIRAYAALTHILAQIWGRNIRYLSITTHAGFMSGIYQIFGLQHHEVPRFPTGIVVPLLVRVEKMKEPIVLADVAPSDSHLNAPSLGYPDALAGKSVDEVLAQISDGDVYARLIRLVEEARKSGTEQDQDWKDRVKLNLSPLEKVIVKALL